MPGAVKMVDTFCDFEVMTILVTGSGQASLLNGLDNDFPFAFPVNRRITSRNVQHGKPNPEPYIKALELSGLSPERAIVVENAPLGIASGTSAGIFTVGVKTGPIPIENFYTAGADLVFNSMSEFAETLPRLLYILNNKNTNV